jgi:hypothetical protein
MRDDRRDLKKNFVMSHSEAKYLELLHLVTNATSISALTPRDFTKATTVTGELSSLTKGAR